MNSVITDRNSTSASTSQIVAGISRQVACRLLLLVASPSRPQRPTTAPRPLTEVFDRTALPELLAQISALLNCEQFAPAERLLQAAIRGLSGSVPPRPPQLREWLMLALFGLLHEDAASADAYVRQAERHHLQDGALAKRADSLFFVLRLTRCLVSLAAHRSGAAEELLEACESAEETACDPHRMWLVLQLRTISALLASQYRVAWQTWQAAMAIQQTRRVLRLAASASDSSGLWLQTMASREVAAANN